MSDSIEWLVVGINPRNPIGQETVIHAVKAETDETFNEINGRRSLCGIRPKYGWDFDLFMDQRCKRCDRIVALKARQP